MFTPLAEDVRNATQEILSHFPRLAGAMKDRYRYRYRATQEPLKIFGGGEQI